MHSFVLIRGNRYRAYFEASPISDIYQCEKCKTQVNTIWLQNHPEQACPMDDDSSLRLVASAAALTAKTQEEGGLYGSSSQENG